MKHPTREECENLLEEYQTPAHVRAHCREVARVACVVGRALKEKGAALDLELILAAGLLHDIARVEDKHWEVGADLLEKLGYGAESEIVRAHMFYSPFSDIGDVTETDLVCLGDRLVKEDRYVGLDDRIEYVVRKAVRNGHEDAVPIIMKKKQETIRFMGQIEAMVGCSIDRLVEGIDGPWAGMEKS